MTILTSISRIAIGAFILTFAAILVELYLISRKDKTKMQKKNIDIPDFDAGTFKPLAQTHTSSVQVKTAVAKNEHHIMLRTYMFALIGMCFLVFAAMALGVFLKKKSESEIVQEVELPAQQIPTTSQSETDAGSFDIARPVTKPTKPIIEPSLTEQVQAFAQAPSPTPTGIVLVSLSITPTLSINQPTKVLATTTPSPTKKTTVTLPVAGNHSVSLLLVVTSLMLIAGAFIF